jgi:uncharacterized protein YcaQ
MPSSSAAARKKYTSSRGRTSGHKRKYGYFSLPILVGDTFVARMDSKADRKNGTLIIHNIHTEPIKLTKSTVMKVCERIRAFATFNRCGSIVVEKSNDKALLNILRREDAS